MSTQFTLRSSIADTRTVRNAGRRAGGSWGRASGGRNIIANRAVRRFAKVILRKNYG
jgi:hypothetical protein